MNCRVPHGGQESLTSDWLLGFICALLVPFCLFLLWTVLVADVSPEERPMLSALPVVLALWLVITATSSFVAGKRSLKLAAIISNGVAMTIGLAYAAKLKISGYTIEDATLSIPVLGITIWFFLNRLVCLRARKAADRYEDT